MTMRRFLKWPYILPLAIVGAPLVLALFVFVAGGMVMLLWNWLLPPLFGVRSITLLQGFGLLVLCRVLFGGWSGGGGGGKGLTRHERERFRHRMRGRACEARHTTGELAGSSIAPTPEQ